jgi:hypothetical protein
MKILLYIVLVAHCMFNRQAFYSFNVCFDGDKLCNTNELIAISKCFENHGFCFLFYNRTKMA